MVEKHGVEVIYLPEEDVKAQRKISIKLLDKRAKTDSYNAEYAKLLKSYLRELGRID
jgi:hypothetical protein